MHYTKFGAARVVDQAVQRLAAERGLSYVEAFTALQVERPELVTAYAATQRNTEGQDTARRQAHRLAKAAIELAARRLGVGFWQVVELLRATRGELVNEAIVLPDAGADVVAARQAQHDQDQAAAELAAQLVVELRPKLAKPAQGGNWHTASRLPRK